MAPKAARNTGASPRVTGLNLDQINFISHFSTNLHQTVNSKESFKTTKCCSDLSAWCFVQKCQKDVASELLSQSHLYLHLHAPRQMSRTHKSLALKYSYSDQVFLWPTRRIPIRIAFHKNSSLKTPDLYIEFTFISFCTILFYNWYQCTCLLNQYILIGNWQWLCL